MASASHTSPTMSADDQSIPMHESSRHLKEHLSMKLQGCRTTRELYQLHAQLLLNGFAQKPFLVAKLLSSCMATANLAHAMHAFNQVTHPSPSLFNQMIRAHAAAAPMTSLLLYNRMRRQCAEPTPFTYSHLLTACSRPNLSLEGRQLHARVLSDGFSSNVFIQTNLITMYAASPGAVPDAYKVFEDMPQRNIVSRNAMLAGCIRSGLVTSAFKLFDGMPERDVVSWTTMIAGCAQSGRCRQALSLFREMRKARACPDQVTMVAALSACADMGDLELGRWIHSRVKHLPWKGEPRLVSLNNALVHMYVKCDDIDEAHRTFRAMTRRSTVSWTTMIAGLVMHGRCDEALDLFDEMRSSGEKPDGVTFIGVLRACSHSGRVDEGRRYLEDMSRVYSVEPTIEHYCCAVDMLGRAGRLSEAQELIAAMPMDPNDAVWGALLSGCKTHRDVELASHVLDRLMELQPEDSSGYLVLLSNAYSAAKRWDDVRRVRRRMAAMGIGKPAGRSWIHVDGALHDFVVGDQTHQRAWEIHKMVREIVDGARLVGNLPEKSEVLLDVEEEEGEEFLSLHSEKLALAFGLISSPGKLDTVRVMSNLRICADCHSIAKYVSEAFCREIVIRDRNRFHHFVGGECSCKDYW